MLGKRRELHCMILHALKHLAIYPDIYSPETITRTGLSPPTNWKMLLAKRLKNSTPLQTRLVCLQQPQVRASVIKKHFQLLVSKTLLACCRKLIKLKRPVEGCPLYSHCLQRKCRLRSTRSTKPKSSSLKAESPSRLYKRSRIRHLQQMMSIRYRNKCQLTHITKRIN